jgi:hypothetical protein
MTAVTNSGPLIVLAKIHHLHLLASLYGTLIVPRAVYREVVEIGRARGYPDLDPSRPLPSRAPGGLGKVKGSSFPKTLELLGPSTALIREPRLRSQ